MITFALFSALATFYFTMFVTPGPNNSMLTFSGLKFGFVRTLPHAIGIPLGHIFQIGLTCFGLGKLFGFSKGVNGIPSAFEIVSSDVNLTNLTIEEEPPIPGNAFQFLYREDGRGNGSSNTGYFAHFRQGKLNSNDFTICVEFPIKAARKNYIIGTIPSFERVRIGGKKKVNAFKDGVLILIKMIKMFFFR